jgi:hypothetical protein
MLDPINPLDPINYDDALSREIDRRGVRTLFFAAVILVFLVLIAWKHVTGHTTGSPQRARQAITTRYVGDYQAVNCSTASSHNPVPGILNDLNPWASNPSNYDCTGTDTTGQPAYWCVSFPSANTTATAEITQQYADGNCG